MDKIKEKTAGHILHPGEDNGCPKGVGPSRPGGWRGPPADAAPWTPPSRGGGNDHGGDQIEDTTADSMRRMERGAEKLIKEKRKNRASRDGSSADSTAGDPAPEIRTREHESRVNAAAADQPAESVGKAGQRIKTKDAYLRAQTETQVSGLSPERTQGQQPFIRERRAAGSAEVRAGQSRADASVRQAAGKSLCNL